MSEKILKALMRLFAIVANADENSTDPRNVVESYLKQLLNKEQIAEYLAIYDDYIKQQNTGAVGEKKKRRLAVSSVKVIVICNQINEELTQKQKFIVLLNLIEFITSNEEVSEQEMAFVSTVASIFNIPDEEFLQSMQLGARSDVPLIEDNSNFLFAGKKSRKGIPAQNT